MATIKPTISITSNSRTSTTPGPLSFALSLSATDSLAVTKVYSEIIDLTNAHKVLLDASDYTASAAEGVDGGFVYVKNLLADPDPAGNTHDIYIGHASVITGGTSAANLTGIDEPRRIMTLKPGEFAWFPWDMTFDLYVDHPETNTGALEVWCFVRTGTA